MAGWPVMRPRRFTLGIKRSTMNFDASRLGGWHDNLCGIPYKQPLEDNIQSLGIHTQTN